jgi:hypothetical protein
MANAGSLDLNEHFASFRTFQVYLNYFKWFAGLKRNSCSCLHGYVSVGITSDDKRQFASV